MTRRLAIVGGGPMATYALERLAARLCAVPPERALSIAVYDRGGQFGAGATHSAGQARTSYMNRVASQIGFAADETNLGARHLLPARLRPTFYEWCAAAYRDSGERQYALLPTDVPHRHLHGQALAYMFRQYVALLRGIGNVSVELHAAEVVDITRDSHGRFLIHAAPVPAAPSSADHVLLVTGHADSEPTPGSRAAALAHHAAAQAGASVPAPGDDVTLAPASSPDPGTARCTYVRNIYPLAQQLSEHVIAPGTAVGMLGTGLSAIDAVLHLTEGRGGRFVPAPGGMAGLHLQYLPGGREPGVIMMASPSGLFPSSRPLNQKAVDGSARSHACHEHQARYLSVAAIRTLRCNFGVPQRLPHGELRQLDFERHVLPLLVLELAVVYYETLLGPAFGHRIENAVKAPYQHFLRYGALSSAHGVDALLAPVQRCFDTAARELDDGAPEAAACSAMRRAFAAVLATSDDHAVSPWQHSTDIRDHRFDWQRLFWPLGRPQAQDGATATAVPATAWRERLLEHMRRDLLDAAQGNLCNPLKAACDGVWRDLRAVFAEMLDFGGLHAQSHRQFMESYFRIYTRLSNGTGVEAMSKLLALIEAGVVDVSAGPGAQARPAAGRPAFQIVSAQGGAPLRQVSILLEARVARFDARRDPAPLYANLLRHGMVRLWRNRGRDGGRAYIPGGLDIDAASHPLRKDGSVDRRITLVGAAAEGVLSFQLSAARPRSNSAIFNRLACWAEELAATLAPATPSQAQTQLQMASATEGAAAAAAGIAQSSAEKDCA